MINGAYEFVKGREEASVCPVHGSVGNFYVYVTAAPEYGTGNICPKCYIDFVKAGCQKVTPAKTRA